MGARSPGVHGLTPTRRNLIQASGLRLRGQLEKATSRLGPRRRDGTHRRRHSEFSTRPDARISDVAEFSNLPPHDINA